MNLWPDLAEIAVATPVVYAAIVVFIRISGKRSTSQMNNFDWIVTVTLGSVAASTILLDDVTLPEGGLAMALLLALQFGLTSAVRKSPAIARIVKASPTTLYEAEAWQDDALARERVTRREVMAAVRGSGLSDMSQVDCVVLETDATLSVVRKG